MKEVKPRTPKPGLEPWHMMVVEKKWSDFEAFHPLRMKGSSSVEITLYK
jgi:hypothetical protein